MKKRVAVFTTSCILVLLPRGTNSTIQLVEAVEAATSGEVPAYDIEAATEIEMQKGPRGPLFRSQKIIGGAPPGEFADDEVAEKPGKGWMKAYLFGILFGVLPQAGAGAASVAQLATAETFFAFVISLLTGGEFDFWSTTAGMLFMGFGASIFLALFTPLIMLRCTGIKVCCSCKGCCSFTLGGSYALAVGAMWYVAVSQVCTRFPCTYMSNAIIDADSSTFTSTKVEGEVVAGAVMGVGLALILALIQWTQYRCLNN